MSGMSHDSYFREVFSNPKQAAGLIRFCLEPADEELLDLDQLEPMPILPILFYHGDQSFHVGTIAEMFPWLPARFARRQPLFDPIFVDLHNRNHEEILTMKGLDESARIALLALQAAFQDDESVLSLFQDLIAKLHQMPSEKRQVYFRRTMIYLMYKSTISPATYEAMMNIGNDEDNTDRMTPAKWFREEGREQGRAAGREEGREEGSRQTQLDNARKMKEEGLQSDLIARITGLTSAEIGEL